MNVLLNVVFLVSFSGVSPATFNGRSSYVQYSNTVIDTGRSFEIKLRLRTRATSGIVFHMAGSGSPFANYMTLELLKTGALQLKYVICVFNLPTVRA